MKVCCWTIVLLAFMHGAHASLVTTALRFKVRPAAARSEPLMAAKKNAKKALTAEEKKELQLKRRTAGGALRSVEI